MVTVSPASPTIVERPEGGSPASATDAIDNKLDSLAIQSDGAPKKKRKNKKPNLPTNNLSIHPTPYIQSPIFSPHSFAAPPPNNERSYLVENRQRQHERGQRLANALHIIEVRIAAAQSKVEGRKLRKEAGLLTKKVAESRRQEQLITFRLHDIDSDELSRSPYWQPQSAGPLPYQPAWSPYSPMAPWTPLTLPLMSPLHGPVSPLTPLPPGLYHPSPIMPSPLNSPFWVGAQYQYQTMAPYMQSDPEYGYYPNAGFPQPYLVPEELAASQPARRQSMTGSVAKLREGNHKGGKSVDFKLPQELEKGASKIRRWSFADTFSPEPKDKRMSVPDLETIWKADQEKEE